MFGTEGLAITYGLCSALVWGSADFTAGFASRKNSVLSVLVFTQLVGMIMLFALALLFAEPMSGLRDNLFGAVAGISGACGGVMLYRALSFGRMGVVAPFSALSAAMLPVLLSIFLEGMPSMVQSAGIGLALLAVWLLSGGATVVEGKRGGIPPELFLSLAAGVGFAGFFICIDQTGDKAFLWPLFFARTASVTLFMLIGRARGELHLPGKRQCALLTLAGILDAGGNLFFALAASLGRLDIAAVLASLYPGATVFWACCLLNERLRAAQWVGVLAALVALVLIAQ